MLILTVHAGVAVDVNRRGEALLVFMSEHNVLVANQGNTPTFSTKRREAVIDLTLCSVDHIPNWKVDLRDSLSDHRGITFKLRSVVCISNTSGILN